MTVVPPALALSTAAWNTGSGLVPGPDAGLRMITAGARPPVAIRSQPDGEKNAGTNEDSQAGAALAVSLTVSPATAASATRMAMTGSQRSRRRGGGNSDGRPVIAGPGPSPAPEPGRAAGRRDWTRRGQ